MSITKTARSSLTCVAGLLHISFLGYLASSYILSLVEKTKTQTLAEGQVLGIRTPAPCLMKAGKERNCRPNACYGQVWFYIL